MKVLKLICFTFVLLLLSASTYANSPFSCKTFQVTPEVKTYIQHPPSYFTKAVPIPAKDKATHFKGFLEPDEDLGTYIGETGGNNNRIVRLQREKNGLAVEYPVPEPYDPVPTPDGRILTVAQPMRIYDIREFMTDIPGFMPTPLVDHEIIPGVYQSLAWMRGAPLENALRDQYNNRQLESNQRLYRLVTDNDDLIPMVDFIITYKPNCDVRQAVRDNKHCVDIEVLKPTTPSELYQSDSWGHCGDTALKTLFISKRGTYLSGYETTQDGGTSKILDISKVGECPVVLDLAHPTGKIDFNDEESMITFHIDYLEDHSGGYFSRVDGRRTKDVYIMDIREPGSAPLPHGKKLSKKNLRRLQTTTKKGEGCYYPSFFADQQKNADGETIERVLCMYDEGNEGTRNDGYSFRITDVTGLRTQTNAFLPTHSEDNLSQAERVRLHNGAILGMVWGRACNPEDTLLYTAVQSASLALNIQASDCKKIADLWGDASEDSNPTTLDFRNNLADDVRFEDDPRFWVPGDILRNISKQSLMASCKVIENYQAELEAKKGNVTTKTYGKANSNNTTQLSGPEIALRKCTGCHHYGGTLNAALEIDEEEGHSSFPSIFEFEGAHEAPLMYIDASLERIGYDPLASDVPQQLQQIENYNPRQDNNLLSYLGTEDATSRLMPPVLREQLEETPENNERKRLGVYLYKLRQERIDEIKGTLQQEEQQ